MHNYASTFCYINNYININKTGQLTIVWFEQKSISSDLGRITTYFPSVQTGK